MEKFLDGKMGGSADHGRDQGPTQRQHRNSFHTVTIARPSPAQQEYPAPPSGYGIYGKGAGERRDFSFGASEDVFEVSELGFGVSSICEGVGDDIKDQFPLFSTE